jgi:hypothetical protein
MHKKRLLDQHTRAVRPSISQQRRTRSTAIKIGKRLVSRYPGETSKQDGGGMMTTAKGNKVKSHKH